MKNLSEAVVVITGASSGIGRATALRCAERGATVVLGARRFEALREVVRECQQKGALALAVPTDVTDHDAVHNLTRQAVLHYGRLDVRVNNAGVLAFGRFDEIPLEDVRRILETDLFGYIYGARAALERFRKQGHGVLINNASVVARLSEPFVSPYVMAQHGIRALGMALRQELALEGLKRISVCTVMPASIDTPFFHHAANYTGRAPQAMPPVYPAEQVAETIVRTAAHPRPEVFVGHSGRRMHLQSLVAPRWTERRVAKMFDQHHLSRDTSAPRSRGNLYEPRPEWTGISGGWRSRRRLPRIATTMAALIAVPTLMTVVFGKR